MDIYGVKRKWKVFLMAFALFIAALSLLYTNQLVQELKIEERKKMELWAEATRKIAGMDNLSQDIDFYVGIITNNNTIPLILTNGQDSIISINNFNERIEQSPQLQYQKLAKIKEDCEPIEIEITASEKNIIYYDDSVVLKQLSVYPYVQLAVIAVFVLLAYYAFSISRRAEQNRVWVGMSKETAHQLGTPISSLLAWLEILQQTPEVDQYVGEMGKDVHRLRMIAERFSKIGSSPELKTGNLVDVLNASVLYMRSRTSEQIKINTCSSNTEPILLALNIPLFNWVIENIIKNSVDAMDGKGEINIDAVIDGKEAHVIISDDGRGIPKRMHKAIFKPGYTTKERGWGLGLSLAHRIIEEYHKGKLFVKHSEPNKGTTLKIILPV